MNMSSLLASLFAESHKEAPTGNFGRRCTIFVRHVDCAVQCASDPPTRSRGRPTISFCRWLSSRLDARAAPPHPIPCSVLWLASAKCPTLPPLRSLPSTPGWDMRATHRSTSIFLRERSLRWVTPPADCRVTPPATTELGGQAYTCDTDLSTRVAPYTTSSRQVTPPAARARKEAPHIPVSQPFLTDPSQQLACRDPAEATTEPHTSTTRHTKQ